MKRKKKINVNHRNSHLEKSNGAKSKTESKSFEEEVEAGFIDIGEIFEGLHKSYATLYKIVDIQGQAIKELQKKIENLSK